MTEYTIVLTLWNHYLFITSYLHMISDSFFESDQMPILSEIHTWEHYLIVQDDFHRFQDSLFEHESSVILSQELSPTLWDHALFTAADFHLFVNSIFTDVQSVAPFFDVFWSEDTFQQL